MKPKHDREAPEPMALILARQGEILKMPEYRKPWIDITKARAAARDFGLCHNSDPFSGARGLHYMRQGYELVSDVQKHATTCLRLRADAKRKEAI